MLYILQLYFFIAGQTAQVALPIWVTLAVQLGEIWAVIKKYTYAATLHHQHMLSSPFKASATSLSFVIREWVNFHVVQNVCCLSWHLQTEEDRDMTQSLQVPARLDPTILTSDYISCNVSIAQTNWLKNYSTCQLATQEIEQGDTKPQKITQNIIKFPGVSHVDYNLFLSSEDPPTNKSNLQFTLHQLMSLLPRQSGSKPAQYVSQQDCSWRHRHCQSQDLWGFKFPGSFSVPSVHLLIPSWWTTNRWQSISPSECQWNI